jgi:hypothetical protein
VRQTREKRRGDEWSKKKRSGAEQSTADQSSVADRRG